MARKPVVDHALAEDLAGIRSLLQDLLIIEAANAGIKKAQVRKIVGVGANRVTRVWKHLNLPGQEKV